MDDTTTTETTTSGTTTSETTTSQLPPSVRTFVAAHAARDADGALAQLAPGAVVRDDGSTYTGEEQLRWFVTEAGTEFSYTDEITGTRRDGDVWVVTHHLEGDFPGGTVDLDHRFALAGEHVVRLDIVVA